MSIWKQLEYLYIQEEKKYGYNRFWWSAWAVTKFTPNNKGLYRAMLRTAKNKKRKIKTINMNHYKRK